MKKAIIIIVGIILIIIAGAVFFLEKPFVDLSQYESLKEPRITEMLNQKMIEVQLTGHPKDTARKAMMQLFPAFYKLRGYGNSIPNPLPRARFSGDFNKIETLVCKYAMQVSENVTQLPPLKDSQVKLVTWEYGTVAEILYVGPYGEEGQTIAKLIKYIQDNGYQVIGELEEEYLKIPDLLGLVKPKDYHTIIRYRVKK